MSYHLGYCAVTTILILAFFALPAAAEDAKCIAAFNKNAGKVASVQGKEIRKCVKAADKAGTPNAAACSIADGKDKVAKAQGRTVDQDVGGASDKCDGTAPTFLYSGAANANSVAAQAALGLAADMFGADLDSSVVTDGDRAKSKCRDQVYKAATKVFDTKAKVFLKCKSQALKTGASDNAAVESACVVAGGPGLVDGNDKVRKSVEKLMGKASKSCIDTSQATDTLFPGDCTGQTGDPAFGVCIDRLIECRVCEMLNDVDGLSIDCDLFDDGLDNSTCGLTRCTGDGECTSDQCECVNESCSSKRCSEVDCSCQFNTDGDGACDGTVVAGTSCGDGSDTDCSDPDTCDGAGSCQNSDAAVGTSCGAGDCDGCDGAGGCGLDSAYSTFHSCSDPSYPLLLPEYYSGMAGACIGGNCEIPYLPLAYIPLQANNTGWVNANTRCGAAYGTHLAWVNTSDNWFDSTAQVAGLVDSCWGVRDAGYSFGDECWIGAYDSTGFDDHVWISGDPFLENIQYSYDPGCLVVDTGGRFYEYDYFARPGLVIGDVCSNPAYPWQDLDSGNWPQP